MPLYEYKCVGCGGREERLQKHSDPPPVCAPCDELMPAETPYMEKLISVGSFSLKGDGWAKDGYSKGGE